MHACWRRTAGALLQHSPPFPWRQGLLLNLQLRGAQRAAAILKSPFTPVLGLQAWMTTPDFLTWILGIPQPLQMLFKG